MAATLFASACTTPVKRAVWAWDADSQAMVQSDPTTDEAIGFLRHKGIETIYLYTEGFGRRSLAADSVGFRHLLSRLHAKGMRAYALLASVLPEGEERAYAAGMLEHVLAYNAGAQPDERFDGVSLDIEPHLLEQWNEHPKELLHDFIDMADVLRKQKREAGQADLPIGAAVPFWLDGIPLRWHGVTKPASEHVIDHLDYIALMDYRDHADGPDGIIANAADELAYAQRVGKKVVIGVEVTSNDVAKVTFNRRSEAEFERELARVERAYADNPAFAGFAIHHYGSYREWLRAQGE